MKISYRWLSRFIANIPPADEIAQLLTSSGLEVEAIEPFETIPGSLSGLVCAKVLTCEPHPNADRLKLTTVDDGSGKVLQVVCGAPNVAAGQHVILARVGTTVHPIEGAPFLIKETSIRGELSQGMLCAEDEVGLGKSHEGIRILPDTLSPGQPLAPVFGAEQDMVFEIGLTPNRIDAISHLAIAREIVALYAIRKGVQLSFTEPEVFSGNASQPSPLAVQVQDTSDCRRYSYACVSGLKGAATPLWMRNLLLAVGSKPVHLAADITNFVMHETGQPMHAFDTANISGASLHVRRGKNEKFELLDGSSCLADADDLVIADTDKPLCLAGVMGGKSSAISANTHSVLFESACFSSALVRRSSKKHSVKSDSSYRFERGSDPQATTFALSRALYLMHSLQPDGVVYASADICPQPVQPRVVEVSYERICLLTGTRPEKEEMKHILHASGMQVEESGAHLMVTVPTAKVDVTREADVAEEFLRMYGYDRVEISGKMQFTPSLIAKANTEEKIAEMLTGKGFTETMSLSLDASDGIHQEGVVPVEIDNPLSSELNVLRTTLMSGMLKTASHNAAHKTPDVQIFEFGKVYATGTDGKVQETSMLGLLSTGKCVEENWNGPATPSSWMQLKEVTLQCLRMLGVDDKKIHTSLCEGGFVLNGNKETELARVLVADKKLLARFDLNVPLIASLINLDACRTFAGGPLRFVPVSRFPAVRRDLALVLDEQVSYEQLEQLAFQTERKILRKVSLFDVYRGDKIPAGKKSYALGFVLQDAEKTLSDKDIEQCMNRLLQRLTKETGALLRS